MIKVKTMTEWPDEDYTYPLPDVSQYSEKERRRLRDKGVSFIVFGFREQIKSDEEFEVCITLVARWNNHKYVDDENYEEDVISDVVHYRFLWYHGRRLLALRKERMKPFIKELVNEVWRILISRGVGEVPLHAGVFFLFFCGRRGWLLQFQAMDGYLYPAVGIYCGRP